MQADQFTRRVEHNKLVAANNRTRCDLGYDRVTHAQNRILANKLLIEILELKREARSWMDEAEWCETKVLEFVADASTDWSFEIARLQEQATTYRQRALELEDQAFLKNTFAQSLRLSPTVNLTQPAILDPAS